MSIYISCLFNQEPIPLTFISKKCNIPRLKISRTHRTIRRELKLEIPPADLKKLVDEFGRALNLPEEVHLKAKYIIKRIVQENIEQGKEPCSIIGGAIYLSGIMCGCKYTQQEIADCLKITEATVRNRYQEISRRIDLIDVENDIEEKSLEIKKIKNQVFVKKNITTTNIIVILSEKWKTLEEILERLNIKDDLDKRFVKIKLKILERNDVILKKIINIKNFWKLKKQ